MWTKPNNVVSYHKRSGQLLKGFPKGSDIVIRSNLGTKQRVNCNTVRMETQLKSGRTSKQIHHQREL